MKSVQLTGLRESTAPRSTSRLIKEAVNLHKSGGSVSHEWLSFPEAPTALSHSNAEIKIIGSRSDIVQLLINPVRFTVSLDCNAIIQGK